MTVRKTSLCGLLLVLSLAPVLAHPADDPGPLVAKAVEGLRSEKEQVRLRSVRMLVVYGVHAAPAVKALTVALGDDSTLIRECAAQALGEVGVGAAPAVPALTKRLGPSPAAAASLGRLLGQVPAVQPALLEALSHEEEAVRLGAARAAAAAGPRAVPLVPALAALLAKDTDAVRIAAADALGAAGSPPGPAVIGLTAALSGESAEVRRAAAWALSEAPFASLETEKALTRLADDGDPVGQAAALWALHRLTGRKKGVLLALVVAVEFDANPVRLIDALGRMGTDAAGAEGCLLGRLDDERQEVRAAAARAAPLVAPSSEAVARALVKALDDPSFPVAAAAVAGLGGLGAKAAPAVPKLVGMLDGPPGTRTSVIEALGSIGPAAKAAEAPLRRITKRARDPVETKAASAALAKIMGK